MERTVANWKFVTTTSPKGPRDMYVAFAKTKAETTKS